MFYFAGSYHSDSLTKCTAKQMPQPRVAENKMQNVPLWTDARIVISTKDVKLILNIWEEILLIKKPLTGQIY